MASLVGFESAENVGSLMQKLIMALGSPGFVFSFGANKIVRFCVEDTRHQFASLFVDTHAEESVAAQQPRACFLAEVRDFGLMQKRIMALGSPGHTSPISSFAC